MKICWRKILLVFSLAAFGVSGLMVEPAQAHHLLPKIKFKCSKDFPCPSAIKPRVRFWIEVFRSWDKETAILHDPQHPQRVYAVFNSGHGCHRAARSKVTRERKRLQKSLRAIATKIEAKKKLSSRKERHLAALFAKKNPREIRAAAVKIRCQSGVRDSFLQGLQNFNNYRPMVDKIIKEHKLPFDIRYLPFVESSYNTVAYSKAGAAGMWQIMPKTARVLGLELNATLDERFDPQAATRVAAKYLKRAERSLNSTARKIQPGIKQAQINPFIITSYNYGVNGMQRAMRQVSVDFMKVLERHKSPRFQTAVKNFYASFLAARHVARNAKRYFGVASTIKISKKSQIVVLPRVTSISRIESVFGLKVAELRPLNYALTRLVWRGQRQIPAGYRLRLPYKESQWQQELTKLASLAPEKIISDYQYIVRRGDTACGIAKRLAVSCRLLIGHNQLGRKAVIYPRQKLLVPNLVGGARRLPPLNANNQYVVRYGDTVCGIAKRFAVNCRQLQALNKLNRKSVIHPRQKLLMPNLVRGGRRLPALNADNLYVVRYGDTACGIAKRFAVSCRQLQALNKLNRKAVIHTRQKLKIPGRTSQTVARTSGDTLKTPASVANISTIAAVVAAQNAPSREARRDEAKALLNLLDTLPDFSLKVTDADTEPVYSVHVEADETIGHFADWLGIGRLDAVRDLNNLRGVHTIHIGQRLLLPVKDANMAEQFMQRRTDYHQVLSETLKQHYELVGIEIYTVKRGDSLWLLSRQLGFPLWLLYRLNPVLRDVRLHPGMLITLPKLKGKVVELSE